MSLTSGHGPLADSLCRQIGGQTMITLSCPGTERIK